MATDRRARRLNPDSAGEQRTLEASLPGPPAPADPAPAESQTPASSPAALRLEERQARWFQSRERVMKRATNAATGSEEISADPKG